MTVLCVSVGSSTREGQRDIAAVEQALRAAAPGCEFARAYTNPVILRLLAEHGAPVCSLAEALDRLDGRAVAIQPTHLLRGREYDRIAQAAAGRSHLRIGKPLLDSPQDLRALAAALDAAYPPAQGESLLLVGHGSPHRSGAVYLELQETFRALGRRDVFVAALRGAPGFSDVLPLLKGRCAAVRLTPLLLVAGEHAANDIAGAQPDSWRGRLEAEGFRARSTLRGLASLPQVRKHYAQHLRELLAER